MIDIRFVRRSDFRFDKKSLNSGGDRIQSDPSADGERRGRGGFVVGLALPGVVEPTPEVPLNAAAFVSSADGRNRS